MKHTVICTLIGIVLINLAVYEYNREQDFKILDKRTETTYFLLKTVNNKLDTILIRTEKKQKFKNKK